MGFVIWARGFETNLVSIQERMAYARYTVAYIPINEPNPEWHSLQPWMDQDGGLGARFHSFFMFNQVAYIQANLSPGVVRCSVNLPCTSTGSA
jgi:hypothetical protein